MFIFFKRDNGMALRSEAPIFPVFCVFLGVLITAFFSWFSNYQQVTATSKSACVIRIDNQEAILRDKYSQFIVAVANFSFAPEFTQPMLESDFRKISLPVITSAMEMTAYATPALSLVASRVMLALYAANTAGNDREKQNHAIGQALLSFKGAHNAYQKSLDELATQRSQCG